MTAALYGELTPGGDRIILMGAGDDYELDRMGAVLRHLTPLLTPTEPAGALSCPATWAAVTQLGHTFHGRLGAWMPGPRLRDWITAEFARRTASLPWDPAVPEGLTARPYQLEAAARIACAGGGFLLADEPGPQPEDTPVWTPGGWRELGRLVPGDIVYDLHGKQVPVRTVKHFGERPVFRVTFSDRASTLATGDHRWRLWTRNDRSGHNRLKAGTGRVLSTGQLLAAGLLQPDGSVRLTDRAGAARFFLPQQPVLRGGTGPADLPLDPYAYGALLGDGSLGSVSHGDFCLSIACPDNEVLFSVAAAATALGTTWRWNSPAGRCQSLSFHRTGKLRTVLGELGALRYSGDKSVHESYLRAGEPARRALLAGLLDTDGGADASCVEFSSASPRLAADVAWLSRSLGAVVTEAAPQRAGYMKNGQKTWTQDRHRLTIRFPADGPNPFTVPRKAEAWAKSALGLQRRRPPRSFQRIEAAGSAPVCCIELDTDDDLARVYLTDTALIPTHNTGKTAGTILGLKARRDVFPLVIITPSWDVCDVFVREIARWAPEWPEPVLYGGTGRATDGAEILITTYATARKDAAGADGPLVKLRAAAVVFDEAHALRNQAALQSLAGRRIAAHANVTVALTGTPVTRDTGDIYPVLAAMDPASWPSRDRFVKRYCQVSGGDYGEKIEGLDPRAEAEFRAALLGGYRRVAKADVLDQLPPKIYSARRVEIPAEWRAAYTSMEEDMLATLPGGGELPVMDTLAKLTRLVQLASSAADVAVTERPDERTGELRKHYEVTLKMPCWKADALLGILAGRPGQPVAVFAPSRQLIELAGAACEKAGYRCGYVTGTAGKKDRAAAIAGFQAGELDVIAVTAGAGGQGITLTAAGTMVFLQRPWSLAESVQCEGRAHRLGSEIHDAVEIIDVIAKNTIEDRIRAALREKAGQLSEFVQDPRIVRELLGGIR